MYRGRSLRCEFRIVFVHVLTRKMEIKHALLSCRRRVLFFFFSRDGHVLARMNRSLMVDATSDKVLLTISRVRERL